MPVTVDSVWSSLPAVTVGAAESLSHCPATAWPVAVNLSGGLPGPGRRGRLDWQPGWHGRVTGIKMHITSPVTKLWYRAHWQISIFNLPSWFPPVAAGPAAPCYGTVTYAVTSQ